MSLRKVKTIARKVRKAFEEIARNEHYSSDLAGLCGRASSQLFLACKRAGINNIELHSSNDHSYNIYNKHIVDVTATQFGHDSEVHVEKVKDVPPSRYHHNSIMQHKSAIRCNHLSYVFKRNGLNKDRRVVQKFLGY